MYYLYLRKFSFNRQEYKAKLMEVHCYKIENCYSTLEDILEITGTSITDIKVLKIYCILMFAEMHTGPLMYPQRSGTIAHLFHVIL